MIGLVKNADLEQVVLILPAEVHLPLLEIMETLLNQDQGKVEQLATLFYLMVKTYEGPLAASSEARLSLSRLRNLVKDK